VIDVWWKKNVTVSFPAGLIRGDFRKWLRHLLAFIQIMVSGIFFFPQDVRSQD